MGCTQQGLWKRHVRSTFYEFSSLYLLNALWCRWKQNLFGGSAGFAVSGSEWGNLQLAETPREPRKIEGRGRWENGVHVLAPRDENLELKLFGMADDKETQHTGINFDKYDNIPVETTGGNVPPCIEQASQL